MTKHRPEPKFKPGEPFRVRLEEGGEPVWVRFGAGEIPVLEEVETRESWMNLIQELDTSGPFEFKYDKIRKMGDKLCNEIALENSEILARTIGNLSSSILPKNKR